MKREKSEAPRTDPCGTTRRNRKERLLCDFEKHSSVPIRKESKQRKRVASQNKFVKKSRMPDRVESFGEVNSSKNRPRTRLQYVKSIRNRLRKIHQE